MQIKTVTGDRQEDPTKEYKDYLDNASDIAEGLDGGVDLALVRDASLIHVEHVNVEVVWIVVGQYLLLNLFAELVEVPVVRRVADPDPTVFRFEAIMLQVTQRVVEQRTVLLIGRKGHGLHVDEVHFLRRGPIVHVLEVYLLLDDPRLHVDVPNVLIDLLI